MPTTEMDLESLIEDAVIAWIANAATHGITLGITGRHAWEDDTDSTPLPAVPVKATIGQASFGVEDGGPSGIWSVAVEVQLRVQAHDTAEATWRTHWHGLRSIFVRDDLASQLSAAASNFKCWGVAWDQPADRQTVDNHWEQTLRFVAHCQSQD